MSTSVDIVDGARPQPVERPGRAYGRPLWWIGVPTAVLLIAAIVAALLVPLPYFALRPGSVLEVESAINVAGAEVYPSSGEVDFTTVSFRQVTLFEAAVGWLDDDVRVVTERFVRGDRSADENRQFNAALMDDSKVTATRVALEHLGYEVPTSLTGETITSVGEATPAEGVLSPGDVIVALDGVRLTELGQLTELLADSRPGDQINLTVDPVERTGETDVTLELAERPDDMPQGFIGVGLAPRDLVYDFPIDVDIESGRIGGPSAGLAFTLSLLDYLTPGELTGGRHVAVTGTISPDGSVGVVGGVAQKAAAVRRAGIELFLVPPGEGDEARSRAGSSLRVVEVRTLQEALEALDDVGGNALALGTPGAAEDPSPGS